MTPDILLSSTLHDPKGVFLEHLKPVSEVILGAYRGWVINVTSVTDSRIKAEIQKFHGRDLYLTEAGSVPPLVPDKIENDHLYLLSETVKIARDLGIRKVQYTDGDRIIVAAKYFPRDLYETARVTSGVIGENMSYLNLRRSPEDYFTHPAPLVQTELEFNRLYSMVFGGPIDISSTAHVMSMDVLESVVVKSPQMESISFPQPKWLIIAQGMGVRIASMETHHILTFETPEQFKREVRKEGGVDEEDYGLVQQTYTATLGLKTTLSPAEWRLRFETERQYLALLQNHLRELGLDDQRREGLSREIAESLSHLEGRQNAILEALPKTPEQ